MTPLRDTENTIIEVKRLVESDRRSEIRLNANGGNSILVVCEPDRELEFIGAINKHMPEDSYRIIDLNMLLNKFIEQNRDVLDETFKLLKSSVNQVFKTPDGEQGSDLFGLITQSIRDSLASGKIPVVIHAGALYGSDIDNIHLMESEYVMNASLPLIILYPATKENETLMFLSKRPASRYRCMVID
jgi:hypothetical protein